MAGLKLFCIVLQVLLYLSAVCTAQDTCKHERSSSGVISGTATYNQGNQCWIIAVPENNYLRLDLRQMSFNSMPCTTTYLNITVAGTEETFTFCYQDAYRKPITVLNDVNVTLVNTDRRGYTASFTLYFNRENLICAQRNHFRCSNETCIHEYQVCDGIKDCENGADEIGCETGISAIKGVNESRAIAIAKLRNKESVSFGWGKNTHRAITALYLSGNANFRGDSLEEELMAKQLELQTSVALLRNSTDPMTVSDLSMFINALTATCHNPRHFYGHDLLQILSDRLATAQSASPGAYLTLCNANWTLPEYHTNNLLNILLKHSGYPFHLDVQAMAVLGLTCAKNKTHDFGFHGGFKLYNTTIQKFISSQLPDGSFGNIYTTALVTQALIASGQQSNKSWRLNSTIQYLMRELNESSDFLSLYFTLPVFSGRTLVDLAKVNCTKRRKHGKDDEISDILNKMGGKMRVQYSLYVGDQRDVVHTIYLRMPENSSAYDVMRVAQVADHKYKFLENDVSGQKYVYEIADITNDPESEQFWLLFIADHRRSTARHHAESPEKLLIRDGDHLIMWYKTVKGTEDFPFLRSTVDPHRYTTNYPRIKDWTITGIPASTKIPKKENFRQNILKWGTVQ